MYPTRYLEKSDTKVHAKAETTIRECYKKNKTEDPKFKSLTNSMITHLRTTVGDLYWLKAHICVHAFLKQRQHRWVATVDSKFQLRRQIHDTIKIGRGQPKPTSVTSSGGLSEVSEA